MFMELDMKELMHQKYNNLIHGAQGGDKCKLIIKTFDDDPFSIHAVEYLKTLSDEVDVYHIRSVRVNPTCIIGPGGENIVHRPFGIELVPEVSICITGVVLTTNVFTETALDFIYSLILKRDMI